jgi:diguanylate cyclase (GGDEF)-like protein
LMSSVRQIDLAARYGGEEFTLILPGSMKQDALVVAERIRRCIDEAVMQSGDNRLHVTISLGVTQFDPARDADNRSIIERADRALYEAKSEGRNRVAFL